MSTAPILTVTAVVAPASTADLIAVVAMVGRTVPFLAASVTLCLHLVCYFPGGHRTLRKHDKPLFYNA
jgi:hypothetical protein